MRPKGGGNWVKYSERNFDEDCVEIRKYTDVTFVIFFFFFLFRTIQNIALEEDFAYYRHVYSSRFASRHAYAERR